MWKISLAGISCYGYMHNRYKQLFESTLMGNRVLGYSVFTEEQVHYVEGFVPLKVVL